MATEECQNIGLSLSDSSSESFYGFGEDTINYTTMPQEAIILTRNLEKIKEKTNQISIKINFNEVCLKNYLLPRFKNFLKM